MIDCGNILCTDTFVGLASLKSGSVDLIFADLPYGTTHNRWDMPLDAQKLWAEYRRVIKPSGAILLFGSGMFTANMMRANSDWWRYNIIWQKTAPTGFLNANRMPLRIHEDIMVFYGKQPTYNPQKTTGHPRKVATAHHKRSSQLGDSYNSYGLTSYDSTERFPTDVWCYPSDRQREAIHPTQKPLALCEHGILTYSNPWDVVLDNTCGSGSILVAAAKHNRHVIGFDNGYCENRRSEYFGKPWAEVTIERIRRLQ